MLSRNAVRRDETLRTDLDRQLRGWSTARLVVVDAEGRTPVDWDGDGPPRGGWDVMDGSGARLRTSPTTGDAPTEGAVLLGEADGVAYWAVRGEPPTGRRRGRHRSASPRPPTVGDWVDLRTAGSALDALGAGLFVAAAAVLNWHDAAGFCPRDGSPTHPAAGGWHRLCEAHGHEEYPRTDPAVICLVHDGADQVLIARQPVWPEGRFSVLAGFVEAGESLEACVARELHEEVGRRGHRHPLPGQPGLAVPAQPDDRLPRPRRPRRAAASRRRRDRRSHVGHPGRPARRPGPRRLGRRAPPSCSPAASPSPARCWSPGPPSP